MTLVDNSNDNARSKENEIQSLQLRTINAIQDGIAKLIEHAFEMGQTKRLIVLPQRLAQWYILGSPELFFNLSEERQYRPEESKNSLTLDLVAVEAEVGRELQPENVFKKAVTAREMAEFFASRKEGRHGYYLYFPEAFWLTSMMEFFEPTLSGKSLVSQLLSAGCSRDGHIQGMQIGGMLPGQSLGAGFYMKQLNELYVRLEEYLARL